MPLNMIGVCVCSPYYYYNCVWGVRCDCSSWMLPVRALFDMSVCEQRGSVGGRMDAKWMQEDIDAHK